MIVERNLCIGMLAGVRGRRGRGPVKTVARLRCPPPITYLKHGSSRPSFNVQAGITPSAGASYHHERPLIAALFEARN